MLDRNAVSLEGKVAVVTGGGGGIGRGIAEAFAAHGASVVLAESDAGRAAETRAAIESGGGEALDVVVDVREPADVERLACETFDRFDHVDILVNNVGHFLRAGRFVDSSSED